MPSDDDNTVAALRARLASATQRIVVLTGAGMSAESGIPTFRDALTGHWARFDPMELASEEGFRANPRRVWDWYAERREGVLAARPNAGHLALGAFETRWPGRLQVVTQNVDDLHQRAGNVGAIRLHGDILKDQWLDDCEHTGHCEVDPEADTGTRPPRCRRCGNLRRPGVVWFGERLPPDALQAAGDAAQAAQVMLVVGTSGAVWPAAGLALAARRAGAHVAILNPEPSEVDGDAHVCLRGTAATLLPRLFDGL